MAQLRIGILGAGHFGRFHALKVAANRRAVLAGLHDPNAKRAESVGARGRAARPRSRSTACSRPATP